MNKVVSINLAGNAYQLDEAGYDKLRAYLDSAARNLGANPDRYEIMADIEQSIGARCKASLNANRTVVSDEAISAAIREMGPVEAGEVSPEPKAARRERRLYRLTDGAQMAGVCNGLAAYLSVDVTIVRFVCVVVAFFTGGIAVLAYIAAQMIIPKAKTIEDVTAAYGNAGTAFDALRRSQDGYYARAKEEISSTPRGPVRNIVILLLGFFICMVLLGLSLQLYNTASGTLEKFSAGSPVWMLLAMLLLAFTILGRLLKNRPRR